MRTTCDQNFSPDVVYWSYYPNSPLPPPPKKGSEWVLIQKKRGCFFWVKPTAANTQKLKLGIQKVHMDDPVVGFVRISDDPLAQPRGGNLHPIPPKVTFLSATKIGEKATNILNCCFHNKFTLCHIK